MNEKTPQQEIIKIKREAITIRNLGPMKAVTIDDIKPFTVFIGESASGKSVIMKVVALFRWLFKRYNLCSYFQVNGAAGSPLESTWKNHVEYAGLDEFISDAEVHYSVTFDDGSQFVIRCQRGELLEPNGPIPAGGVSYSKLSYIPEMRSVLPYLLKSKVFPDIECHFQEMVEDFARGCAKRNSLDIDFLRIQFSSESDALGWMQHHVSGLDGVHPPIGFSSSASGIQNTVPILLLSSYFARDFDMKKAFKDKLKMEGVSRGMVERIPDSDTDIPSKHIFMHIEEPELGLFPDAQCDLLNRLVGFMTGTKYNPLRFMLTTHSPFILAYINNMLQAGQIPGFQGGAGLPLPLAPGSTAVYQIVAGACVPLLDEETGLIRGNVIDDCSSKIYAQFDKLLDMERNEKN